MSFISESLQRQLQSPPAMKGLATCLCLHDDYWFLAHVIRSVKTVGDVVCFIGRKAWDGSDGPFQRVAEIAEAEGAEVIVGDWPDEATHRREALAAMRARGHTHILTLDGDEIPDAKLLDHLKRLADNDLADVVRVKMDTYWKDAAHIIRPREEIAPVALVNCQTVTHLRIREYVGPRLLVLEPDYGVLHHLSYAGPDERIQRKISSWSHRHELIQRWYHDKWKGWEADPLLRDLHPTHPHCYGAIERIEPVEALRDLPRWREEPEFAKPENWPKVSVVIPLYGGPEELLQCLNSLAKLQDLLHEVIVVDDASPDQAPAIVANYTFAQLLKNETNQGFAATCNNGARRSTGDVVFFLNSDTIVPRAGLIRLIEGLMESGTIGAAGPVSNEVGYYQRINPTYKHPLPVGLLSTSSGLSNSFIERQVSPLNEVGGETSPMSVRTGRGLPARSVPSIDKEGTDRVETSSDLPESAGGGEGSTLSHRERDVARSEASLRRDEGENSPLDLFAQDLALSQREDQDVEMLVGFALAVRRTVLDEVGLFDESFGPGLYEDNDLSYRILRAGYRLRVVSKAFVHHWGSRTLNRTMPDPGVLLHQNAEIFKAKWKADIESGYASHLPGFAQGPIKFDEARKPEKIAKLIAGLKDQADISLTMIVRNEERVLGACLESAKPFFKQIIVVDTGSTDRTIEIAKEHGAEVHEIPWPDSFAQARNESLRYAKGKWIFWLDADDTLPAWCGERILHAAINAPPDIAGYVVPVQFVDSGPGAGTRVDHVKLFRNKPDLRWEGRIHEQILAPLRKYGEIARIDAVVMHSGYDTSDAGQKKKRDRDWHLLKLDLAERPGHPFVLFNIGMTNHFTDGHEAAVDWLRRSIDKSGPNDSHLRKAWSMMGVSLRILGRLEEAEAAFREGIIRVGGDAELSFQLAMTLVTQGRLAEAKSVYEAMPTGIDDHFSSVDIGILTFKRIHNLASVVLALGDYRAARELYLQAIQQNPGFVASAYELFEAALNATDYRTARQTLEAIQRVEGPSLAWAERFGRLSEESATSDETLRALDGLVAAHPNQVGPRLVFARKLLATGLVAHAEPHLLLLAHSGVPEAAFFLSVARLRTGQLDDAIGFAEQAVLLNPGHQQSVEQLEKLKALVGDLPPCTLPPDEAKKLLTGPHAGKLGKGTKPRSVVIVTYNSANFIGPCLESVLPTLGPRDEVIIVDNASTDSTVEMAMAQKDSRVRIIVSESNDGYSSAANTGILASYGRRIALLNPDTVVAPNWLSAMEARLGKDVGAVGPVSDNIAGQQFVAHYLAPGPRPHYSELPGLLAYEKSGHSVETQLLMGMCLLVSRAVFNAVGLLDVATILGSDDLDFSWRLTNLGYRLIVALDTFVHHECGASFAQRPRAETAALVAQSDRAFIRKLVAFYGPDLPSTYRLFGCGILAEALKNAEIRS